MKLPRPIVLPKNPNIDGHERAHRRFATHANLRYGLWRLSKAAAHLAIQHGDLRTFQCAIIDMLALVKYWPTAQTLGGARARAHQDLGLDERSMSDNARIWAAHDLLYEENERRCHQRAIAQE